MTGRSCAQCNHSFPKDGYSSSQYRKGANVSRCKACVSDGEGPSSSREDVVEQTLDQFSEMSLAPRRGGGDDDDTTPGGSDDGDEISLMHVELLNGRVRALEEILETYDKDEAIMQHLATQKDLSLLIAEREKFIEERRVKSVLTQWEEGVPNLNIDDENMECPICEAYLPLDGTTVVPGGSSVYQKRFLCCGTRYCRSHDKELSLKLLACGMSSSCPACQDVLCITEAYVTERFFVHAKNGKTWAQSLIGGKYFYGSGLRKDEKKAVYWFQLSAEKGNINGLMMMAQLHMMGSCGFSKSLPEAMRYVQKAAERGDETAQFLFAKSGSGEERLKYLTLLADDHVQAQYMLGQWWAEKEGSIDESTERSIYWYTLASQGGDARAQFELSKSLIGRALDRYNAMSLPGYSPLPQAFCWAQRSARQGYPPALDHLAMLKEECGDHCAVCCKERSECRLRPCKCCGAAYYCGERCRVEHLEVGHRADCYIPLLR